jgi:hypothetical protein
MTAFKRGMAQDRKQGIEVVGLQAALLPCVGIAQVFLEVGHDGPRDNFVQTRLFETRFARVAVRASDAEQQRCCDAP